MNILLETNVTPQVREKYLLLELDSFRFSPDTPPVPAYCLVEKLSLEEMMVMQPYLDLHNKLMYNYRQRNWNYVEQAIEHLMGRWNQELDTFYINLQERVKNFKEQQLSEDWDGIIERK